MAAANFSRDILEISTTYTNGLIDLESVIENPVVSEYDKICFLNADAANFSRDVLEEQNTFTGDLIDFETVIETPVDEENLKSRLINVEKSKKEYVKEYLKKRNNCHWLKIGKKETCGKRCEEFYCNTHSKCVKKGGKIPLPCLCCGVGVRRPNQLCTRCEKKYGVEFK